MAAVNSFVVAASVAGRWRVFHGRQFYIIFRRSGSLSNGQTTSLEGIKVHAASKIRLLPKHQPIGICPKLMLSTSSTTHPSLTDEEEAAIQTIAIDILSRDNDDCSDENSTISSRNIKKRISLSKAITLVESRSPRKRLMADKLLKKLKNSKSDMNTATSSFRLGIAGPPGVGKSTFVEAFGTYILGLQAQEDKLDRSNTFLPEKLAVLCIDPSSHVTGGSILGDKARMSYLSHHPRAFVRPSPSSGTLGGLGSYTYDAASLCELAGYQLTLIETVGVGQSEVELAECCDLFLLILAPGGGDELQGYKKGIVEVADVLVVNKADGETQTIARKTANDYKSALGLLRKPAEWWGGTNLPPVLLVSAKAGTGMKELWEIITKYKQYAESSGLLLKKRQHQNRYWMWKYLQGHVLETAMRDNRVKRKKEEIERSLDNGRVAPRAAAAELWRSIVGDVIDDNQT
jgi:LAO/AO transport system kinase